MAASEMTDVVDLIADNPMIGTSIAGTNGCRKVRFGRPGRGKSGGYRVITFFSGPDLPVFLLTVFAKNEKGNLTQAERNALAGLTKELISRYPERERRRKR